MNFDQDKAKNWLMRTSSALTNLVNILEQSTSEVLIIGASVFDIYYEQGWIPAFKRKTGDLDLSVGLSTGEENYKILKRAFLSNGYKVEDPDIEYRFFSPRKIPGGLTYVDLLAHPTSKSISDSLTRQIIGMGESFSFDGFEFARLKAFNIQDNLFCPNPIAMMGLKLTSYQDNPTRVKDLADVAEIAYGIVEKGTHFDMGGLWNSIKKHPSASFISKTLNELGSNESVRWDLDNARSELMSRNFSATEIDDLIPARLSDWASQLTV